MKPWKLLRACGGAAHPSGGLRVEQCGYLRRAEPHHLSRGLTINSPIEEQDRTLSLLRATLESTADGLLVVDSAGKVATYNKRFLKLWRIPPALVEQGDDAKLIGFVLDQLTDPDAFIAKIQHLYHNPSETSVDVLAFKDGRTFERYSLPQTIGEDIVGRVWSFRDVTEREQAQSALRESEEQLRHSQKMEAIGSLSGGIAHDFNNLLTVISGHCELILRSMTGPTPMTTDVIAIRDAARRAAEMTQQLLAFGRRQVLHPEVVELNSFLSSVQTMLHRLVREDVRIELALGSEAATVHVDRGQMQQLLLNLAVNARDAMPAGGTLRIAVSNTSLDAAEAVSLSVGPGRYVELCVSDTGSGMTPVVQRRIFEPFFTTKELGKGTGLGLSSVYGIVHQSGGGIRVESVAGAGSTFRIFLPFVSAEGLGSRSATPPFGTSRLGNRETILVVEDERAVRTVVHRLLSARGYVVEQAADGEAALDIAERLPEPPALLITDVVMPRMNGRELAERLRKRWPELRVLFVSGYTDDEVVRRGIGDFGASFLQKPFTGDSLLDRVGSLLAGTTGYDRVQPESK